MPSVRAIAAQLKLSAATVSRVLNNHADVDESTRQRVLDRINKTGYVQRVGRLVTNVVALAYPDEPVRSEYGSFEPSLLNGIMRGLHEQHFDLKLLSIRRDKSPDENYTQFFLRKGIQGVLLRCTHRNSDMITQIVKEGFPSVVVAARFEDPDINFIHADSYPSSRRAVEHLLGLGHRRIVLAIHNVPDTDHTDRRRAYEDAHAAAGLPLDPSLVMELPDSLSSGEQVVDAMLAMPRRPTAVFATNPMTALGIMRRAQERGLAVPAELSVVGVDDSDVRMHVWPRLTAVTQDASTIGYEAASWLTRCLTQEESVRTCRRTIATTFEVNGTTAAPPADERPESPSVALTLAQKHATRPRRSRSGTPRAAISRTRKR
ncbi:MAG: LacI family transcriptional regulator [Planctomycetota bacterium]|nr:MAG: LacI family transcriptional regulator [Planctomycetota bacterium]